MKKTLAILTIFFTHGIYGQITDDSSELVYSARTTQIIHESDLKNNQTRERFPDTTLYDLEKFTEVDRRQHKYQDLGNNGTAMFPVFYPVPEQIGRTSGLYAYDPYMVDPKTFKYYDTKSPFTNLMVVFGGKGRSMVDLTYTRNVNENWNVGFDIYRITSDKQIGKSGQGDRNVVGTIFDLFSYYNPKDKPYAMTVHLANMAYNIEETGGIYLEDLDEATAADLFEYQDSDIQLRDARSTDDRLNIHLYHEYNWKKQLQFYHQLDRKRQTVGYQDFQDNAAGDYNPYTDYYELFLLGTDSTYEKYEWKELVNEAGIKGNLANLFYRIYLKRRDLDMDYLYLDPTDRFSETFLGGYTRFDWRDKFNVEAMAEILQSGEYKLIGNLNSDLVFGSYKSTRYKPSFLVEKYFGNHGDWDQSFTSAFSNEITGGINLELGNLLVRPKARIVSMDNFYYYDQDQTPRQSGDLALISSFGGNFNFKLFTNKKYGEAFHLENEVYYTALSGSGSDKIRMPEIFYNGKLFWRGLWFNNSMGVEVGFDVHAKTQYFALAYAPHIQQFYLQDEFRIDSFYTADFFLNMKVNNLRAFLKMTNINQQADSGYFVTPYYPGQSQTFDFGVRWMFFD